MTKSSKTQSWLPLLGFLAVCYVVFGFGGLFQPGDWYESLERAPWSPPNIAFPIVWVILYALIAISGWLIYRQQNTKLLGLWIAQLLFNGLWSWLFFGQDWVVLGLIDLVLIDFLVALLILGCLKNGQKLCSLLLLPYLVWLVLATSLNVYILVHN